MDEHQAILARLERLQELVARELGEPSAPDARARLEEIASIGRHLVDAEPHHQREEQVLFPALRELGIEGPPNVMEAEHVELRALKHAVAEGAAKILESGDGAGVARGFARNARQLVGLLRDHIAKEDHVLYPMAVQAIAPAEWERMKARCDEIGYCCGGHDR